jgi:thiamine-monophosphate kinase
MMKKLREFDLIGRIRQRSAADARVPIGPGDDMAQVALPTPQVLLSVDQLVEGLHFDLQTASLEAVGYKAMARSLSDIAAMAAQPAASVAGAVLPRRLAPDEVDRLFTAMHDCAAHFDCPLVGGDITIWDGPLMLNTTVAAAPTDRGVIQRRGAKAGDLVCVTGALGGSLASGRHLRFPPRIREAMRLHEALEHELHALIDLSDGLGRDAGHIAEESDVTIRLDAAALPASPGCDWRRALGDGEDYELCFTTSADRQRLSGLDIGVPVTVVGEVIERREDDPFVLIRTPEGREEPGHEFGWEHGA